MITSSKTPQILVGAPLANMSSVKDADQRPTGAVFACPLSTGAGDCRELPVEIATSPGFKSLRRRQFLGMATASATALGGDKAFTCAPGLKVRNSFVGSIAYPGGCVELNNDLRGTRNVRVPDCTQSGTKTITAFCMRGMSLAADAGNRVLLGAPFETSSGIVNSGVAYLAGDRDRALKVTEKKLPSPSYVGWSVAMGRVYAAANLTVASGGPGMPSEFSSLKQAEIGMGLVLLQYIDAAGPRFAQRLIGKQFGSRFGHSLLIVDVNKDGWDDLLVGAPDFRSDKASVGGGAVYVYLSTQGKVLMLKNVLRPPKMSVDECKRQRCPRAQFGFALSNLQDVNLDGFSDVGVSAPGMGRGVIYVFHGSAEGLSGPPVQAIALTTAKDLGYSLGHGMDLDNNGYPDLVAGAMGSDSAAIFRARPIIRIRPTVTFKPSVLHPNFSRNAWQPCPRGGGFCVAVTVKFGYERASSRDRTSAAFPGSLTLEADVAAAGRSETVRAKFLGAGKSRNSRLVLAVTFQATPSERRVWLALEKNQFIDKLRPIDVRLSWALNLTAPGPLPAGALPPISRFPVYDAGNSAREVQLPWTDVCPRTGCLSDLQLDVRSSLAPDPDQGSGARFVYYMGRDNFIWMNFTARNFVGVAHRVQLTFKTSSSVSVDKALCEYGCQLGPSSTTCGLSNPLLAGRGVVCSLRLSTASLRPELRFLNFSAHVTTLSRNLDNRKTLLRFRAAVKIQAQVLLTSSAEPSQIVYRSGRVIGASAIKHEKKIGDPRVHISFKVENRLSSLVPMSTLTILWPFELVGDRREPHGKYLLYLLKDPEVESKDPKSVRCDQAALKQLVNPLGVRLLKAAEGGQPVRNYSAGAPPAIRYRRDAPTPTFAPLPGLNGSVSCSDDLARCVPIRCRLGNLGKKTGPITVKFVSRLWMHTLVEDFEDRKYVSIAVAARWASDPRFSVTQLNRTNPAAEPQEKVSVTHKAVLIASNAMDRKPKPPPNFTLIVVGAAVGGIILLGCIVIVLWKCNFFKRTNMRQKKERMLRESRMAPPPGPDRD